MQLKVSPDQLTQLTQSNKNEVNPTQNDKNQDHNNQYYEEYKRLYYTSYLLSLQLKHLSVSKDDLWVKISRLEKKTDNFKDDIRGEPSEKKKRFRRIAEQISRNFVCEVERCNKCYGSEGSLQQHIKLKHPEIYQSKSPLNVKNSILHQSDAAYFD